MFDFLVLPSSFTIQFQIVVVKLRKQKQKNKTKIGFYVCLDWIPTQLDSKNEGTNIFLVAVQ